MARPGFRNWLAMQRYLYYLSDEAKEGKNAFIEKREPDWSKYPKFP